MRIAAAGAGADGGSRPVCVGRPQRRCGRQSGESRQSPDLRGSAVRATARGSESCWSRKFCPSTARRWLLFIAISRWENTTGRIPAAIAARWVYEQSRELGIIIRREMLAEQNSINAQNLKQWLTDFADRNHLDPKAIVASLTDQRLIAVVDQDRQAAVARGVNRAPTVFVGGVPFVETDHITKSSPGRLTTRLPSEGKPGGFRVLIF